MSFDHVKFGRKIPKDRSYEDKYSLKSLSYKIPFKVNKSLRLPKNLIPFYDQGEYGACVGFSASWQTSIYNSNLLVIRKYDGMWMWNQAKANDNDPSTNPNDDNGSYCWAAQWVLQKFGHERYGNKRPTLGDGIKSYYWGKDSNDGRLAISQNKPFVLGINWYHSFMTPVFDSKTKRWWIGTSTNLGAIDGGHAICAWEAYDNYEAFGLVNSWGKEFPLVLIPYKVVDRLMKEDGEMVMGTDKITP
jgi:hypothetical protein